MQFNQITYFLRLCDSLNFTRAAEACHVSQPSLSAAIKKLEDELGGDLFVRSGRSVELTALGESMRVHLGRIEQTMQAANVAAADIVHGSASVINLGLMCTLSPRLLLSAISSFGHEYPNNQLLVHDVWEARAFELLLSGALDCILLAHTEPLSDRFAEQHLADEKMLLAVHNSHPFSNRNSIRFEELQNQPYVDRLKCEFREIFFKELGARNLGVQVVLRSEREDLVRESIAEAVGVSIMPESAATSSAALNTVEVDDLNIVRKISIVTVGDREPHPAMQHFVRHVCDAYK